jgi:altronate hydrolase
MIVFPTGAIGEGYLRQDGKKGIRNKVLVIFTVDCSAHVAFKIAEHFKARGEDVDVLGSRSCGDNQVNIRRLLSYSVHPNVGATLFVGNGCEFTLPDKLCEFARKEGRLSDWFYLQTSGGTLKSTQKGIGIVSGFLAELKKTQKTPVYLKDLVFGGECGGSDFASGLAGNPLVGRFFDNIIDLGGTCVFEEMAEAIGLREYLAGRAVNEQVRKDIENTYDKTVHLCKQTGQFSIAPGNMKGGLTTVEEKSMGATVKSGTRLISGVLKIAQRPKKPGLYIMDNLNDELYDCSFINSADAYSLMDLIALGTHINFLVTGRGHTIGNPITPCVKITGNPRTYENMSDDIDINAGRVLLGENSLDEMTQELLDYVIAICNGARCKAEKLGHQESEFVLSLQDPSRVIRPKGCIA